MKSRLFMIGIGMLLLIGTVYIISLSIQQERIDLPPSSVYTSSSPSIPSERQVFSRAKDALYYQQMPEGNRTMKNYAENRAYPGAPPSIPHPLVSEKGIGGKTCLQCHQNGGYVDQFKAFAPVVPHPELLNCKQCHVAKVTSQQFAKTDWETVNSPAIHQVAMPGAPPMIPHDLQMRDNCLSCHAGPAARKEIKTSHPERINCRQCHLPINKQDIFIKPTPNENIDAFSKSIGKVDAEIDQEEMHLISAWVQSTQGGKQATHE